MDEKRAVNWSGKKVLVTGAGGFIGSHLCEALVREGASVRAFTRYTSRNTVGLLAYLPDEIRTQIQLVSGDLRDPDAVQKAVAGREYVFHLGSLVGIPYSYVHPVEVVNTNINGALNVLNASVQSGVTRLVHTSTSEVYGSAVSVPMSEEHVLNAQSPYSASKVGADMLALSYHLSFDLPVATLRPFNTYGPRQSGRAIIPTIIGQALHRGEVHIGSTAPTRDFTFITDTVAAFLAIAGCQEAEGRVLNAGNGKEISVGDLARLVVERVGKPAEIVTEEERIRPGKSEVNRLLCDATLMNQLTGWEPRVSLAEGIDAVIEFMRRHPDWTDVMGYEV